MSYRGLKGEGLTGVEGRGRIVAVDVPSGGVAVLDDLTDVVITAPADNEVLSYDSGSGEWLNQTPTGGAPSAHATSHENGGADEINVGGLSGLLADTQHPIIGSGATEAVAGNDGRLTNSRTPTLHASSHQNGGSDEIDVGGLSGLLADGQTPLAHKTSHQSGGSDAIKLDDLATPDDNTDLNASAAHHGLLPKLSGSGSDVLHGDGSWSPGASAYTDENAQDAVGGILTDSATIDTTYNDGVPSITFDVKPASITEAMQVLADNTTQDVSITKHGYAPKAPNDGTKFLDGTGGWSVPPSGLTNPMTTLGDLIKGGVAGAPGRLAIGAEGQSLKVSSGAPVWVDDIRTFVFAFDGGGAAILAGAQAFIYVPFGCTILSVTALADVVGSAVVDLWNDSYANHPPTVFDTIVAGAPITISAAIKSQDATLTGWTLTLAADSVLKANINSISTMTKLSITIKVKRTS